MCCLQLKNSWKVHLNIEEILIENLLVCNRSISNIIIIPDIDDYIEYEKSINFLKTNTHFHPTNLRKETKMLLKIKFSNRIEFLYAMRLSVLFFRDNSTCMKTVKSNLSEAHTRKPA